MSNLVMAAICRLLSQYRFTIDSETTTDDLTCIICKNVLANAYQTYCGCAYCRKCIDAYLSDEDKHCCGNKDDCNEEFLVLDFNVSRNAMLNKKILKAKVICPNESCTFSAGLEVIEEHIRVCQIQSIECPYLSIGCDNEIVSEDTILTHLHNDSLTHSQLLIEYIQGLKNELRQLSTSFVNLQEDFRLKEIQNTELINNLNEQSRNTRISIENETRKRVISENESVARLKTMEETVKRIKLSPEGTLLKVDRFSAKMTVTECIYGPYFYSHTNGYKLRLQLYPGGNAIGTLTHFSVFIIICKGEYDDTLLWPCQHTFTVSIVDQRNNGTHNKKTISPSTVLDSNKHYNNKPTNKDNIGCGYPTFISHEELRSIVGVIVDDCVVIKCVVTAPS